MITIRKEDICKKYRFVLKGTNVRKFFEFMIFFIVGGILSADARFTDSLKKNTVGSACSWRSSVLWEKSLFFIKNNLDR